MGETVPGEYAKECRGEQWTGLEGGEYGHLYRACVHVEAEPPTGTGSDGDWPQIPPDASLDSCPADFEGAIVRYRGTELGGCARFDQEPPTDPLQSYPSYDIDIQSCSAPDGESADPVIQLWDGHVVFCAAAFVVVGDPVPPVDVSTEPCRPDAADPEVRVGNGRVEVCVALSVLGGDLDPSPGSPW